MNLFIFSIFPENSEFSLEMVQGERNKARRASGSKFLQTISSFHFSGFSFRLFPFSPFSFFVFPENSKFSVSLLRLSVFPLVVLTGLVFWKVNFYLDQFREHCSLQLSLSNSQLEFSWRFHCGGERSLSKKAENEINRKSTRKSYLVASIANNLGFSLVSPRRLCQIQPRLR